MKALEQPKCRPLPSPTATSVATESVPAPGDTNIGWATTKVVVAAILAHTLFFFFWQGVHSPPGAAPGRGAGREGLCQLRRRVRQQPGPGLPGRAGRRRHRLPALRRGLPPVSQIGRAF